jgi:hypothetical protein
MDGAIFIGVDGTPLVNGLSNDVDDSAESLGTNGHHNGRANVSDALSTDETLSRVEGDGTDVVAAKMLGNFEDQTVLGTLDLKRIENRGQVALELHIDDGTNDGGNFSVSGLYSRAEGTCSKNMLTGHIEIDLRVEANFVSMTLN